jgi:hypothetical protein
LRRAQVQWTPIIAADSKSSLINKLTHNAYVDLKQGLRGAELKQDLRGPEVGHTMREIVIDTEATGLALLDGHRAVELVGTIKGRRAS